MCSEKPARIRYANRLLDLSCEPYGNNLEDKVQIPTNQIVLLQTEDIDVEQTLSIFKWEAHRRCLYP